MADKEEAKESNPGPSSGSGSASKQRKKVYNMEPRTPLKRQRVPVQRFQSPATEEQPPAVTPKAKPVKDEITVTYKKGTFVAVRGDEGSFYLCRTQQNVYNNTKHFKIQWLDLSEPPNIYKLDFLDHTEIECVLTNVKMERVARETFRLQHSEKTRIENILTKALKKEKGEPVDEQDIEMIQDTDNEDEEDEEDWEDEPTPKKVKLSKGGKVTPKSRKSVTVALSKGPTQQKKSTAKGKSQGKKAEKEKAKKVKKEKKKAEKTEKKRGPDRKLKPNLNIKVLEKDPLFDTKDHVPFISKKAHGKLVFRAVLQNDMALLKELLKDDQHIHEVGEARSLADPYSPLHYALKNNNGTAVGLLSADCLGEGSKERLKSGCPPCLINTMDTGTYNPRFLGIRAVRQLTVSRGSKEGNQAFVKEQDSDHVLEEIISESLRMGVKKETLDTLIANSNEHSRGVYEEDAMRNIWQAIIRGHRELAGEYIEEGFKRGGFGFNFLHKDVLVFNNEDLKTFHSASARKKPFENVAITPIHCACINPNTKYLEKLLSVEPDINIEDKNGRRPIHYAAACNGTGPLELLLKKGANPSETTKRKFTPLHYACYADRPKNVDILMKICASKLAAEGDGSDLSVNKWGVGGINRPNWESICPIHIAVQTGSAELVQTLVKHGVDVNKQLSASKDKLTPLMIAAGKGYLKIARLLVQAGATIEQLDKHKCTALSHAVMNGSVPVASYLLYLGADPNRTDSSGNTLVHYAAAYGWYFVLKLLVNDGGADPKRANDWKLTPVGIAFLKAHMGLVDFLLKMPGVDINFKNDTGKTLISIACSSSLSSGLYDQIVYLMDKGADPKITDMNGFNALHHLAAQSVKNSRQYNVDVQKQYDENMDLTLKIAELLLKAGCDPSVKTDQKATAVSLAIENVNTKLVKYLVEKGGAVSAQKNEEGCNALHLLAKQCMGNDLAPLLKIIAQENKMNDIKENGLDEKMEVDDNGVSDEDGPPVLKPEMDVVPTLKKNASFRSGLEVIKQMVTEVNHAGYTPFLTACQTYSAYQPSTESGHTPFLSRLFKTPTNQKPDNTKEAEIQKIYQNGREFIKTLIDLTDLDVSQTVQKKYFESDPPAEEKKQYDQHGKWSAAHFLVTKHKKAKTNVSTDCLKLLTEKKLDLELKNLDGLSALSCAVSDQNDEVVQFLLTAGANPNTSWPLDKESTVTPLMTAAKTCNVDIVKSLVKAGANVNCCDSKTKKTPLHLCMANRAKENITLEIMKILLDGGADINAVDNKKRTPLHLAVNFNSGTSNASTDMEEMLINRGANMFLKDYSGRMPLHLAFVKIGQDVFSSALDPIELCSVLTKAMNDQRIDEPDAFNQSALHHAAFRGATICCIHLIQRKAEISRRDKQGNTPLSFAVNNGHDSCALMLIQKGANVKDNVVIAPPMVLDEDKPKEVKKEKPILQWKPLKVEEKENIETYSIFQEAIKKELQGVAHMILDNTDLNSRIIEAALRVNQFNVALRLLKKITDNGKLQMTNDKGQNLFHVLALYTTSGTQTEAQLKFAKALLDRGVPLSSQDNNGCTPLHYAALKHQAFALGQFIVDNDKSCDISKKDKFNRSALAAYLWGCKNMHSQVEEIKKWSKMFLGKGASFDFLFDYPLPELPLFDVQTHEVPDYFTTTCATKISPLMLLIHQSEFDLIKFILENGASPNFTDSQGTTPLMHAIKMNDLAIVKLLLNHSYDMEDATGSTQKSSLQKKLSRPVFTIKPLESFNSIPEEEPEEEENDEENNEEDEEPAEEEAPEDEEAEDNPEEDDADDNEDSDHDTVDMEDDEEEDAAERFPSLTRTLSKQPSLLRQGSSLNKEEFPSVEKTSPVDVNATDSQGFTAVHHLVCPLEYGTFDNEEMLYVLWKAGADVQKKDHAGLSPLDHALIRGARKVANRLQKISVVSEDKMEKPTLASYEVSCSVLSADAVNYTADAEEMLKQIDEKNMEVSKDDNEDEVDVIAKVDPTCQIKENAGEVVMDDTQGIPYDVLLSKVDVSCGTYGMYNFYKMQIIWQKGVDIYILFTRWGRIGDRGQYQHTPFQKKAEAIQEFGKIFRSKTGNYWSTVNSFERHPNKYRLVEREEKHAKEHKINFSLQSDIPSKLPEPLQDLLKEMTNVNLMNAAVNKVGIDVECNPFGRIKRKVLIEARKLLNKLGDVIKLVVDLRKPGRIMSTEDTAKYHSNCEEISKITNEYYHLIPHYGFTFEKIKPISDFNTLRTHMQALSNLMDLECASRILLGAQSKLSQTNPLDYVYQAMGCKIQQVAEDSTEAQYILKYIYSSCANYKIQAIFKLSREGEDARLAEKGVANHRLLWHGSSLANFISILHRGLLVCPPEVPMTGNLFGAGVYFADAFAKSLGYSYNTNPDSDTKLMLLSEVALGNCQDKQNITEDDFEDLRDTSFNSRKVAANVEPDSHYDVTLPYGPVMPLGMLKETMKQQERVRHFYRMPYTEYIVQDPAQISLRYLVQFTEASRR